MDFGLTDDQQAIVDGVTATIGRFGDNYWLERDREGSFPHEFYQTVADGGWLGIAMPEEFGGAGLGVTEAALMMAAIAGSGGAMAAASSVHMNIFGPHAIVKHGSDAQKARWLPGLIDGSYKMCFAVTEPDAGLDTTRIKTRAERDGNGYIVHGQKIWTSTAQVTEKVMLLARTGPREDGSPADGLSLFFTDLDRGNASVHEIEKMGRKAVDSNEIFFDGMRVSVADRIGEEGQGFRYLIQSLNPERIILAALCCGIGRFALNKGVAYASERNVFGQPIGAHQGVQHPMAKAHTAVEMASLMTRRAAWEFDNKLPAGASSNMAKYAAAEAGIEAELKAAGFNAHELKAAKFRAADLRAVGFHAKDLRAARFRPVDLRNAGFTVQELREVDGSADQVDAALLQQRLVPRLSQSTRRLPVALSLQIRRRAVIVHEHERGARLVVGVHLVGHDLRELRTITDVEKTPFITTLLQVR